MKPIRITGEELGADHLRQLGGSIDVASITAGHQTRCLRKGVGVSVWDYDYIHSELKFVNTFINGWNPGIEIQCSNEVGNCGCPHAETKALHFLYMTVVKQRFTASERCFIFAQNYSPCTSCAAAIALSSLVSAVVWRVDTDHDMRGIDILKDNNILGVKI